MADEKGTPTTPELPPLNPINPAVFDKPQFDAFVERFQNSPEGAARVIARTLAGELQQENPDAFTYESLRDGTARFFDYSPTTRNLAPAERSLTDEQIITLFATDTEGNPIESGTFLAGFQREIAPAATSGGAFVAGARAGAKLPIPHPLGRLAAATVTGIGASLLGYKGGELLTDAVLGPERPLLPGQTAAYEQGKTAASVVAFLPMPFAVSRNVSLGTAEYLTNLASRGIETAPRSVRLVQGAENLLGRMGASARSAPIFTTTAEMIAGTGQVVGAGMAEERAPGDPLTRLAYETIGSVGSNIIGNPTVALLYNAGNIMPILRNVRDQYRQGGLRQVLSPIKNARQNQAVGRIVEILEADELSRAQNSGVGDAAVAAARERGVTDPAELNRIKQDAETEAMRSGVNNVIDRLASDDLSNLLLDENGRPIPLTAGAKSGHPAMLAIEASLAQLDGALGKDRVAGSKSAIKALRNVILAMAQTGDQAALQQAADLAESVFSANLNNRMTDATTRVLDAFERVGFTEGTNVRLSERLYDVVTNQMRLARDKERQLWGAVPDITIDTFVDANGNASTTPQFIQRWRELFANAPQEYRDEYERSMPALASFVSRKANELGLGTMLQPDSPQLRSARSAAQTAANRLVGTANEGAVETFLNGQRSQNLSDDAIISNLRSAADNIRSTPTSQRGPRDIAYAAALDAQANLMALQAREAQAAAASGASQITGELTSNDLTKMRSLALEYGRTAMANGQENRARMAFDMADAMLSDLSNVPAGPGQDNYRVAYDMARAYSRALNDTFTRSFAGDAMATTRTGGDRIAPELLASRLLQAGNDPTYVRVMQINEIGNFAAREGLEGAEETIGTLRGVTEQILRNARAAAFDPETGQINPRRLQSWMQQNEDVLSQFPALRRDLMDAQTANILLDETSQARRKAIAEERAQMSFYNLMNPVVDRETGRRMFGTESPTTAIAQALNPENFAPIRSLNRLLAVVEGTDDPQLREQAMTGFKSALLEWAATKAGGSHSGKFSPSTLYDAMFRPIRGSSGRIPLMDWMLEKGIINQAEATNLKTYLTEMVKFEASEQTGEIGELVERAGPILDFYLSITGSALGTKAQSLITGGKSGPGALIAAGRGAETMRRIFADLPASMQTDVMGELMRNPELLATMMRRPRSQREKMRLMQRAGQILADLGFRPVVDVYPSVEREFMREREDIPPPSPNLPPPNQQGALVPPAQLPTQGGGAAPSPVQLASAAPQRPPIQSSGPVDRTKYAALFPEDRELLGIGSLMGG